MVWWLKKKKKQASAGENGDFGVEDPFEAMFEGFGEMDDMVKEIDKMMKKVLEGSQLQFPKDFAKNVRPGKPMVYGFSMTLGPDGKPHFEEFGNVQPQKKAVADEREPLVDVIEKEKEISVLAELPGVEKSEIQLKLEEDNKKLHIFIPQKFNKLIDLPARVKEDVSKARYKNGVLEVNLEKEKESKPKFKQIPIE